MDLYKFTQLFLKKRVVFIINAKEFDKLNFIESKNSLSFELITPSNFCKISDIYELTESSSKAEIFRNRLMFPDIWKGIIATLDGKPVGCHWILLPTKNKLFYDGFELDNTVALFCGVFVNPNYRGKRIYNSMQRFVYKMWIDNFPNRSVITIVEEKNIPSLESNLRIGLKIKGVNYLFKLFGKNFLSVCYSANHKIRVWSVLSTKKW